MLTAAFFVLITVTILNANRMVIDSQVTYYEQVALEQGTSYANSLLQEILTKKFDYNEQFHPLDYYMKTWNFVRSSSLGPSPAARSRISPWPDVEPYKSVMGATNAYYAVGDYNGYERIANSEDIKGFHLKVTVYYVNKDSPDVASTRTYYKRIDVSVDHPVYLKRPITISGLAAY